MLKRLALIAAVLLPAGAVMAEEGVSLPSAGTDINNVASLQRGARNFMNYCSGCHSLRYLRYNRMAADLKIPEALMTSNLMFTSDKAFDPVISAMPADSTAWFGKAPPDLTLEARAKGTDFIYAYLRGFYADNTRIWGVNNMILPGTAMPHVLESLQGLQKPVFKSEAEGGTSTMVLSGVEPMLPGALKPEEYDQFVRDIANFLDYAAEPVKAKRQSLGIFVTLFLLVFFVFAYLLKKEYWKDIH
jgi:ubiquinol-cytochrome c reductase cytochrome c1 subunit